MSDQPDGLPTADDILGTDGDPFDGPYSPVQDTDDDADPDDTPEDADMDLGDGARLISADVSCRNCSKRDVCALIRGIAPMLESWDPGEAPVDVHELAIICDAYDPEEVDD